jgi:glycosyltransferase involved in cell wall biosynthesis
LNGIGVQADVVSSTDFGLLTREHFDVVHIQYPTVGFGRTLIPQKLALLYKCVVTLHEASRAHILRKLSLPFFALRSRRLIFTTEIERRYATSRVPWISKFSCVIPLASNIPAFEGASRRNLNEIVYFGLIMPKKGLESVISLAGLIAAKELPFIVRIVGSSSSRYQEYLAQLKAVTSDLPVIWDFDLSEREVAHRLSSSAIAYLPYPDGASERRTTLKAAFLNGVAVITTRGPHTPASIKSLVRVCQSPEEALTAICSLREEQALREELADKGRRYGSQFTWERIALAHRLLYDSLLQ